MFESILAFCVILKAGGEPTNPCWMVRENTRFPSFDACRAYGDIKEAQVSLRIVNEYDVAPVVTIQCGPVKEGT